MKARTQNRPSTPLYPALPLAVPVLFLMAAILAFPTAAAASEAAAGQEAFVALKCNLCHSVEAVDIAAKTKSDKMKGPDLSSSSELDVEWAFQYIKRDVLKDDKQHKKEFKGTDEELTAILDWLATLETSPAH